MDFSQRRKENSRTGKPKEDMKMKKKGREDPLHGPRRDHLDHGSTLPHIHHKQKSSNILKNEFTMVCCPVFSLSLRRLRPKSRRKNPARRNHLILCQVLQVFVFSRENLREKVDFSWRLKQNRSINWSKNLKGNK